MIEDRDPLSDERQSQQDRLTRRQANLRPLPPKRCTVTKTGRGIRCWVMDWDRTPSTPNPNSTVEYRVRWTPLCDLSTTTGISAAFARAIQVAVIPANGGEAESLIVDEERQSGFYFFVGADKDGHESEFVSPPRFILGQTLSSAIPNVVTRFSATESGVARDGTVWSLVSFSMLAPDPLGSFFAVQPILQNYPNRNDISAFGQREYAGAGGGSIQWDMILPVGRRKGKGTVQATNGSPTVTFGGAENCLVSVAAGEYLEILGVQAQVKSVDSPTQVTLGIPAGAAQNWTGKTCVLADNMDYDFIATVTIYMRSLSQDGNGEIDLSQLPSATVVLDGLLSAPNAPVLTAARDGTTHVSTLGRTNRLFIAPVNGVQIKSYFLYRGKGAGLAFTDPLMQRIDPAIADHRNNTGLIQFDDPNFGQYDLEQNQVFSYYATAVNARDQESAASALVEVACRLDSPSDGGGIIPARFVAPNLLWNAMLSGDAGDINAASNASVDANMGVALPAGYHRPAGSVSGVGSAPAYQNGREILLAMTAGALPGVSLVGWTIDASDHATAANRRVPKAKMVSFQTKARHSFGSINGFLKADVVQVNNGASGTVTGATNATPIVIATGAAHGFATGQKRVWIFGVTGNTAANGVWTITVTDATHFSLNGSVGNGAYGAGGTIYGLAGLKRRRSNDTIDYDDVQLVIDGAIITDVHSLYWGAFYLDPAFVTEQITCRIWYETTNWSGVNLAIMEPMWALGDGIPYWSAAVDPNTTYPPTGGGFAPPGRFADRDGSGRDIIKLP